MISDVSLSGNILETMRKIMLVGKKPKILPRTGFCGKGGQSVPVGEKVPFIMLKEAIVGGH
jgi:TldD protein